MERIKEIYPVTKRLLGLIEPCGESTADAIRLENLEQTIEVTEKLINDIVGVSTNVSSYEASVKRAGVTAREFILNLKEQLSHYH